MRVLFVPLATRTHYWPMVPIAWALRAAGHEVRVAAQPGLVDAVRESGMTPVTVGRDYDIARRMNELKEEFTREIQQQASQPGGMPQELPPSLERRIFELKFGPQAELTDAVAEDLVSLARAWQPDLVIGDPVMQYAAPLAAAASEATLVRHLFGPDFPTHVGFFPGIGTGELGSERGHWPESLLRIYDHYKVDISANYYAMALDPGPASLQLPGVSNATSYGCMPYNGSGELPGWLLKSPGAPRICVTQGHATTHLLGSEGSPVPAIIAGLADLDAEIIVGVRSEDRGLLANPPANVRINAEWLPLNLVLPTCSAVVHQGGAGTTLTSIFSGTPQVIVPQVLDQAFHAERLASSGAAVAVNPSQIADPAQLGGAIAQAVRGLLEDGNPVVQAAQDLQKEMASQPAPAEIVGKLESLVS
jgi:UDP:flavonoid glycosyltransferase YjiC (YdhE family)